MKQSLVISTGAQILPPMNRKLKTTDTPTRLIAHVGQRPLARAAMWLVSELQNAAKYNTKHTAANTIPALPLESVQPGDHDTVDPQGTYRYCTVRIEKDVDSCTKIIFFPNTYSVAKPTWNRIREDPTILLSSFQEHHLFRSRPSDLTPSL